MVLKDGEENSSNQKSLQGIKRKPTANHFKKNKKNT